MTWNTTRVAGASSCVVDMIKTYGWDVRVEKMSQTFLKNIEYRSLRLKQSSWGKVMNLFVAKYRTLAKSTMHLVIGIGMILEILRTFPTSTDVVAGK